MGEEGSEASNTVTVSDRIQLYGRCRGGRRENVHDESRCFGEFLEISKKKAARYWNMLILCRIFVVVGSCGFLPPKPS